MNHSLVTLALQEPASDSYTWIIIGVVLFLLFFVVVIIAVGLAIFLVMRKRKKARAAAAPAVSVASVPGSPAYAETPLPEATPLTPMSEAPQPVFESAPPAQQPSADSIPVAPLEADSSAVPADFDPSRTVAISRENTVAISYGSITFVSGVLAGQTFDISPEGSYIGRESSLSQIVVSDPRISKRHLWIGVRDGLVKIVDQDSRNGTFVNDPKSERVTEATLNPGDTVILGESDVARFEYQT